MIIARAFPFIASTVDQGLDKTKRCLSDSSAQDAGIADILQIQLMNIWTAIFLVTNAVYWAVFFYLLSRRRWNAATLAVGLFHMLLASVLSVAPFRSLLDSDYRWQLGFVSFDGRTAAIPAFLTLGHIRRFSLVRASFFQE